MFYYFYLKGASKRLIKGMKVAVTKRRNFVNVYLLKIVAENFKDFRVKPNFVFKPILFKRK